MSRVRRLLHAARIRRLVQIGFLLAFVGLLVSVRFRAETEPGPLEKVFLLADPLLLAATWLAAHAVPALLLWSLVVLGITVLAGRVFCGWVCPLGAVHAIASRLLRPWRGKRKPRDPWSRWQLAKYYLLAGLLAGAAFGFHWVTIFDPIVLLTRTTTTALLPAAQWSVEEGSTAIYQADGEYGTVKKLHLTAATEPAYAFLRDHVFTIPKQAFLGGAIIFAFFAGTLALNAYRPRFWCRYLCPLGALLGIFSWRPLLRRNVQEAGCNRCDLCGMACHGAAAVGPGEGWRPSECLGCFNCSDACRRDSLSFRLAWPWRRQPRLERLDLSKRALFASAFGGLAALAVARISPQARGRQFNPLLIRPPGSRAEREFLQRCTSCGLCMKVCPTGGLQPTLVEAGWEGLWTPRLVPQIGYCDHNCTASGNLCGRVCPTEAIQALTLDEKHAAHIGLAAFDTTRCIPYAYGRDCMVCEEHCPVPHKAIYCLEVEVTDRDGNRTKIKQPHVDAALCTGCGVCENVCPYKDSPGIRVTSANEDRHPDNQPLLAGGSPY
jgi:polyferredoxin